MRKIISLIALTICLLGVNTASAQCIQIESILVDACGAEEGLNEMVRFKVGAAAVNTSNMSVDWPNNNWQGLVQNATTAAKVTQLNADIQAAGGCGVLLEPTGGVLPANATVILVTSFNMDTALNQFGPITETIYILFQNNPAVATGHFANFGTGLRTLEISFGSCFESVTYDRSQLVSPTGTQTAADGATVNFTPAGVATYVNNGCAAPVPPFTVDAGTTPVSACPGATINLSGSAVGYQNVQWSAPSGTFSASTSLATTYTLPADASGPITITLTATNVCNAQITDTITVNLAAAIAPTFNIATSFCTGSTVPTLPTSSQNGISGTWSPSNISNTASGTYVFTPSVGQCASPFTLNVTITDSIAPTFDLVTTFCSGSTVPTLPATSQNGINGTWAPSTISNTADGAYVFTPTAGQCASPFTLNVTITPQAVPNFALEANICDGATPPVLPSTSLNGITGTWNPAVVSNTTPGTYVFTPDAGQCAATYTHSIGIVSSIVPTFSLNTTYCSGSTVDVLPATSDDGIPGTWSPAVISNTESGTYVFTSIMNTCVAPYTLTVTITDSTIPDFELTQTICPEAAPSVLPTTSPNGISGTWAPAVVDGAGSYVFTPDAGQCAQTVTMVATVSQADFTVTQLCQGTNAMLEVAGNFGFEISSATWYNASDVEVGTGDTFNVTEWLASNPGTTFPIDFTVAVTGSEGCVFTQDVSVAAVWCGIPKGVSVNGDNANDTFNLSGLGVSQLKIFSRYGREVYSKNDYTNQWVGQSNDNSELPEGTYYFVISTYSGETKTGWVYLIRKA